MTALADSLRRRIAIDGPLTVAQYMAEALGHPRHGYYATRDPLGTAGDFITAPEISQMFGELIGLWCADAWVRMDAPDPVSLVELGPGRGTLMADALRAAGWAMPAFRRAIEIHLVETSPALRAAQARALVAAEPTWHDGLDTVPERPALVVANEFFDALPIRQWLCTADGWHERLVDRDEQTDSLRFVLARRADPTVPALVPAAIAAEPGALVESAPAALNQAALLGARLAKHGGAVLIIDYGPASPTPGDTLQAVSRHRSVHPLAAPGEADLTAHVDFRALAGAARRAGVVVHGPIPQGQFLAALGIAERARRLAEARPDRAASIDAARRRLVAPDQMGMLFKAMVLAHPAVGLPAGFAHAEPAGQKDETTWEARA
jgi:NADH dehydrogenase [ubiquinone] 1 alpha subcomplex assembly factor 7